MKDYRKWIKENREFLLTLLVLLLIGLLPLLGIFMGKEDKREIALEQEVRFSQSGEIDSSGYPSSEKRPASYFLKPSAEEVLDMIMQSGDSVLPAENQRYTGLRVMWPTYFFQVIDDSSTMLKVLLDVDKDGFGVVVQTEIDSLKYPEIRNLEQGEKVWIAGEIREVDVTGTGAVYMRTEQVSFKEELEQAIGKQSR